MIIAGSRSIVLPDLAAVWRSCGGETAESKTVDGPGAKSGSTTRLAELLSSSVSPPFALRLCWPVKAYEARRRRSQTAIGEKVAAATEG